MTETELIELALRTVDADLKKMAFDRPEITAKVHGTSNPGEATRFVHSWIASTVDDLRDRLATRADDHGITLEQA